MITKYKPLSFDEALYYLNKDHNTTKLDLSKFTKEELLKLHTLTLGKDELPAPNIIQYLTFDDTVNMSAIAMRYWCIYASGDEINVYIKQHEALMDGISQHEFDFALTNKSLNQDSLSILVKCTTLDSNIFYHELCTMDFILNNLKYLDIQYYFKNFPIPCEYHQMIFDAICKVDIHTIIGGVFGDVYIESVDNDDMVDLLFNTQYITKEFIMNNIDYIMEKHYIHLSNEIDEHMFVTNNLNQENLKYMNINNFSLEYVKSNSHYFTPNQLGNYKLIDNELVIRFIDNVEFRSIIIQRIHEITQTIRPDLINNILNYELINNDDIVNI